MKRKLLKSIAAFVLALGLLELTAQAIKINCLPPKWYKIDTTNRLDPEWPAGKTIDYADIVRGRGARLGTLSVNSLGFRGPERHLSDEHAPGRVRVYCLGSSTTFGWGATTDAATYPAQLEQYLKDILPKLNVEVINAGIPGNGSHDELGILEADLVALKPDIVVICSGWPDWTHYMSPGVTSAQFQPTGIVGVVRRSGAFCCAEYFRDQFIPRPSPPTEEQLAQRKGLSHFRTEVLESFKSNLAKMLRTCRGRGARPIVVAMASPLRAPADELTPLARSQAANRLYALPNASIPNLRQGILDFDAAFEETCQLCGVSYIDPQTLPSDPLLFFDGVHMTDVGYSSLARSIAPQVLQAAQDLEQPH